MENQKMNNQQVRDYLEKSGVSMEDLSSELRLTSWHFRELLQHWLTDEQIANLKEAVDTVKARPVPEPVPVLKFPDFTEGDQDIGELMRDRYWFPYELGQALKARGCEDPGLIDAHASQYAMRDGYTPEQRAEILALFADMPNMDLWRKIREHGVRLETVAKKLEGEDRRILGEGDVEAMLDSELSPEQRKRLELAIEAARQRRFS